MLKEKTGDIVEDKDLEIIVREGYEDGFPDNDIYRRLYEKYPRLKDNDESEYKKYDAYCISGSISGTHMDDGRTVVTWYAGKAHEEPKFDDIVRSANIFNEYLFANGLSCTIGFPEGMCGEQWTTVKKALGELADIHTSVNFIIMKPDKE